MSNSTDRDIPSRRPVDMHPIAKVHLGEVIGLVEAVDEVGGQADAATIAQEFDMDLDRLGPVIDAAEFLGLMAVAEGDLKTTDLSRKVLTGTQKERKAIIREIIEDVPVFRQVTGLLRRREVMSKDEVMEVLSSRVGTHAARDFFDALVYWGRYVELIRYDSETEELALRQPSK